MLIHVVVCNSWLLIHVVVCFRLLDSLQLTDSVLDYLATLFSPFCHRPAKKLWHHVVVCHGLWFLFVCSIRSCQDLVLYSLVKNSCCSHFHVTDFCILLCCTLFSITRVVLSHVTDFCILLCCTLFSITRVVLSHVTDFLKQSVRKLYKCMLFLLINACNLKLFPLSQVLSSFLFLQSEALSSISSYFFNLKFFLLSCSFNLKFVIVSYKKKKNKIKHNIEKNTTFYIMASSSHNNEGVNDENFDQYFDQYFDETFDNFFENYGGQEDETKRRKKRVYIERNREEGHIRL